MRILCLDDERLALKMLVNCVKKVKPDAEVEAFGDQDELIADAKEKYGFPEVETASFTCFQDGK